MGMETERTDPNMIGSGSALRKSTRKASLDAWMSICVTRYSIKHCNTPCLVLGVDRGAAEDLKEQVEELPAGITRHVALLECHL